MTEDDWSAMKEFMRGVAFTVGVTGFFVLIIAILGEWGEAEKSGPPVPKSSAKVVGTYKDCDIVRWTNHQLADYKYFLHCDNK